MHRKAEVNKHAANIMKHTIFIPYLFALVDAQRRSFSDYNILCVSNAFSISSITFGRAGKDRTKGKSGSGKDRAPRFAMAKIV
jgi:hypothetical protein